MAKKISAKAVDVELVPPPTVKTEEDKVTGLRERAMLVRTRTRFWHGVGADEIVTSEVRIAKEAKGNIGTFVKRIMDQEVLAKLLKIIRDWRRYERAHTMAWGDDSVRLLSIESFFAYKKEAAKASRDFEIAVDELVKSYPAAVEAQRKRLGKLWRADDYPNAQSVRSYFALRMYVEPIPMGDDFRVKLSKAEAEEIRASYDAEVKARLKGAVRDVFDQMHNLVTELRDKLANADANIRKGSFESLRKLCAVLPQLNVAVQDPHIRDIGNQIARDLITVDAGAVNDDQAMRDSVKTKADKLLAALKPLRK